VVNTFQLRPHQDKQIKEARQALRDYQSILLQAPTGCGKTVMASFMVASAHNKGHDVIFQVHRRELVEQTIKTFEKAGIPHTVIGAGYHYNPRMRVAIATVGTLVNRLESVRPPRLFIPDEAHHCTATSWNKTVQWAKKYGAKVVGLSATPWRLSGEGLRDQFQHMVMGPSVSYLMENGYLSKYRAFAPSAPDMSNVHERGGDFVQQEIEQVMTGKAVISDFVGQWRAKALGKRTVGFASSIKHSELLVQEFNAAGIPAVHIDANTPPELRKQHILNFAAGYIPVIWNVDLFGEGFDLSAMAGRDVPIEAVIQGRPTMSLSLHLQQLGRALRPKAEPAIILDHAGNIMRHGLPDSPYEWTLDARPKKEKGGGDGAEERSKQCPKCYFVHEPFYPKCPNCGHVYEKVGRQLDEVSGDLKEITRADVDAAREEAGDKRGKQLELPLESLIDMAYARGLKAGDAEKWAAHQFTARMARRKRA